MINFSPFISLLSFSKSIYLIICGIELWKLLEKIKYDHFFDNCSDFFPKIEKKKWCSFDSLRGKKK